METIKGLPEAVEDKDDFASVIVARDESLAHYASVPGLGPPDLCWLQKSSKGTWSTSTAEPKGYYHFVSGRDVSSSAAIAAYFAQLNAKVEPISLMQGLWYTSEVKIDRGFYCCYDPFTQLDVRCELCIPGGVMCGALDAIGTVTGVTDEIWRNLTVAGFLRSQLYDPELCSKVYILHRYQPLSSPEAEAHLLKAVLDMYTVKLLPMALEFITSDVGRGCTAEHMDLVLYTVFHYLGARHRWSTALDFFTRLQEVYLPAAVYVAAVQRELDSFDSSFATLSAALEVQPSDPYLLLSLANECLYAEQVDMAAKLARRAIRLHRTLRPAWLLLARCYIRQGLYSLALITLNVVPPPPQPMNEQELLLCVVPPEPGYVTKPSTPIYDADIQAVQAMIKEEVGCDGSRGLLYLPAAMMLPREPLDLGAWPDLGPYRITRAVVASAYGLLQELVAAIGWDSFLEMRARVFVMQKEAVAGDAAAGTRVQDPKAAKEVSAAFETALEELAAIGLSEYPEDIEEARAANRAAAQAAAQAEEEERQAAAAKQQAARLDSTGTATQPAEATPGQVLVSVKSEGARAADAAAPDADEASQAQSVKQASGEELQHTTSGPALSSASSVQGMLMSIPGTTALWNLMLGVAKPQPGYQDIQLDETQLAKLRQHDSRPLPSSHSAQQQFKNTAGPVAEASAPEQHQRITHTHAHVAWAGDTVQCAQANPWSDSDPAHCAGTTTLLHSSLGHLLIHLHQQAPCLKASRASISSTADSQWYKECLSAKRLVTPGHSRCSTSLYQSARPGMRKRVVRRMRQLPRRLASLLLCMSMLPCEQPAHSPSLLLLLQRLQASHRAPQSAAAAGQPVCEARDPPDEGSTVSDDDLGLPDSDDDEHQVEPGRQLGADMMRRMKQRNVKLGQQQASAGRPVSHVEADRDFVLLGAAALEQVEDSQDKAKRLCVRWLDELIIALWHDLQVYMEWKQMDQQMQASCGNTLSGTILGLPGSATASARESAPGRAGSESTAAYSSGRVETGLPGATGYQLTGGDWMRRGLLAERLYHDQEALQAYRCCLAVGGFNVLAAHSVMRLAAEAGDMSLAVQACVSVLAWHACHLPAGATNTHLSTPASCCLGHVAAAQEPDQMQLLLEQALASKGIPSVGQAGSTGQTQHAANPSSSSLEITAALLDTVKVWAKQLLKGTSRPAR